MPTPSALLTIERLWNGLPAWAGERSLVSFTLATAGLAVEITAPWHNDPPPNAAPGRTDKLWEYEVMELFLANEAGHYLELEFGPHGHFLALRFSGIRQPSHDDIPLSFTATRIGDHWQGHAHIAAASLPDALTCANAYAIHGQGENRRYLAAFPVPGPHPDFHQPHRFQPW